jgi:hypothetical protein
MVKRRSPLFMQHTPGGVFDYVSIDRYPADVWIVQSVHAAASDTAGFGTSPDAPFATLDYCISQMASGDVAICMPGHVETVAVAGGLDLDQAGIWIIGVGEGDLQPNINLTDPASDVDIDAHNITVVHMRFTAAAADITAAIDVNAHDFTLRDCRFTGDNAGLNALIWVQDAAAGASNRITIEDCYLNDVDASNTHFINFAGTGTGHIIRRNVLIGDFGTMCIGGAGVVTLTTVMDNVINNASNVVDSCINFAAASTGICVRNLACGAAAQANGITATAMTVAENYYGVVTEDLSAILDPIAT